MSILGKLHEISLYGLISTIICLCTGKATISSMWSARLNIDGFSSFFLVFLLGASVFFVPIAIIGAFYTKYADNGEGLSFESDKILVIIFAHIAEELLGLVLSPFWFLAALFGHNMRKNGRIADYITYAIELAFFITGIIVL